MFTAEVFVGQTKGIGNKKAPTVLRLLLYINRRKDYSHSIVADGFGDMS
jgi:hypothetical protein